MIRHWWLMLLVGILVIIAGILVFVFPAQSYFALGVLFGILMLLSGAAQLVIAGTSGNYLVMRSYVVQNTSFMKSNIVKNRMMVLNSDMLIRLNS